MIDDILREESLKDHLNKGFPRSADGSTWKYSNRVAYWKACFLRGQDLKDRNHYRNFKFLEIYMLITFSLQVIWS